MASPLAAPPVLGRGAIILPGQAPPESLAQAERIRVDTHTLRADHETITRLHRAWATRTPVVVELGVDPTALTEEEHTSTPVWDLGLDFLFPRERLRFLVWANNVDARFCGPDVPDGRWWHTIKACQGGLIRPAALDQPGDVVLPDGQVAYIDGGPRDAVMTGATVLHREDLEAGITQIIGQPSSPHILDTLTQDQQGAVRAGHGAVRVPAPAGSGKTWVLSARLATVLQARQFPAQSMLALVYNTRAAEELRQRVGDNRVTINTVHAHAYGLLRRHVPGIRVLDEREVRNALTHLVDVPKKANSDPLGPWIEAIDTVRATLISPEQAAETIGADLPDFARCFYAYRERMRESRVVDFAEMVPWATELLLSNAEIRHREQALATQVLVDEFQDLTPAYLLYIRLLASPQLAVFGVGDDDQVIYGHAGANPKFLIDFEHYFPGSTSHTLAINHRCPRDVVVKTNTLLAHNNTRISKEIQYGVHASTQPIGVHEVSHEEEATKAMEVVRTHLDNGVLAHEIAILARVNVALLPVQAALTKAGIALHSPITPGLLERSAVRAALTYLRLATTTPMHGDDLADILHRPLRAIPGQVKSTLVGRTWTMEDLHAIPITLSHFQQKAWRAFLADLRLLRRSARHQPSAEVLRRIIVDIDLGAVAKELEDNKQHPGGSTHTDDLASLVLVAHYCQDVTAFEPFLRQVLNPPKPIGPAITLSSIHKVKGLEWPYVLIVGANEGIMPHRMAQDPTTIEEERRIFHVAITRAQTQLDIIAQRKSASRFISEMNGQTPVVHTRTQVKPTLLGTRRKEKQEEPSVRAVMGLKVTIAGGLSGEIVEIRGSDIFLATQSRAILRVGAGSSVTVDGKRVRLYVR